MKRGEGSFPPDLPQGFIPLFLNACLAYSQNSDFSHRSNSNLPSFPGPSVYITEEIRESQDWNTRPRTFDVDLE